MKIFKEVLKEKFDIGRINVAYIDKDKKIKKLEKEALEKYK